MEAATAMAELERLDLRASVRALPEHETRALLGDLGALTEPVRATWHGRMVNEHGSSRVFEALAARLDALDEREAAHECRTFADEERLHGTLCAAVVVAAGGEADAWVPRGREMPVHADTTPRAAVVRNVIAIACMAETVAVALIGAERLEMPEGPLRTLLDRIYADEVGHARFGWRFLARTWPALSETERAAVEAYLPLALGHLEAHELAHLPAGTTWPAGASDYGLCRGDDARGLFYDAVTEIIVPQLEAHGLRAERAWAQRRTS